MSNADSPPADPAPPTGDNPISNLLTESAAASWNRVRGDGGTISVIIFRDAGEIKTQRQAVEVATRITKAAGWPAWKMVNLSREKHKFAEDHPRHAGRELQCVFVHGKVEAKR